MNPDIRLFKESDRHLLRVLYLASRQHAFPWMEGASFQLEDFDRDTAGELILVAYQDENPVGFVSAWEPERFIHNLFVRPDAIGRGIGSALLERCLTNIGRPATLKCVPRNIRARDFYLAKGWRIAAEHHDSEDPYLLMRSSASPEREHPEPRGAVVPTRTVAIRPYRSSDLADLVRLFSESVHVLGAAHYDTAQREAWAPQAPDRAAWNTRLSQQNVLVAEEDCRICGFIAYTDSGHVDMLFVAPTYARKKVGTALYQATEAALAAAGIQAISTEASLIARPFFERQGFFVEEAQEVERGGAVLARFLMRKRI